MPCSAGDCNCSPAWSGRPEQDERQPPGQLSCARGGSKPAARRRPLQSAALIEACLYTGGKTLNMSQGTPVAAHGRSLRQVQAAASRVHSSDMSLVGFPATNASAKPTNCACLCSASPALLQSPCQRDTAYSLQHTISLCPALPRVPAQEPGSPCRLLCRRVLPAHRGLQG